MSNERFQPTDRYKEESVVFDDRYALTIGYYRNGPGKWDYTRGEVRDAAGNLIADVRRNYMRFWYCYIAEHPNGHAYLLCGENYQGQTVIELDTGKRVDYLPEEAERGWAFCWASVEWDSETPLELEVNGCYWACPYEYVRYDFANPLALPYPVLSRSWEDPEEEDDDDAEEGPVTP